MAQRLIVGLGTGRCGTHSLAQLLAAQEGVDAAHERKPALSWEGEADPGRHFRHAPQSKAEIVADVGFYYLPHVERLASEFPLMRFVCLKRDRAETIESFCRVESGVNWFSWQGPQSEWSRSFPKYERYSFRRAVGMYWDDYYEEADRLSVLLRHRFRIVPTEALNQLEQVRGLLDYCGVARPQIHLYHLASSRRSTA